MWSFIYSNDLRDLFPKSRGAEETVVVMMVVYSLWV